MFFGEVCDNCLCYMWFLVVPTFEKKVNLCKKGFNTKVLSNSSLVSVGNIFLCFSQSGQIWSNLVKSGQTSGQTSGQIWPNLVKSGFHQISKI